MDVLDSSPVEPLRQNALLVIGIAFNQKFRDNQPKHPVAKEFQALVIMGSGAARTGAGMRKSAAQPG